MSEENIKRYTDEELDEMIARGESQTNWDRLKNMTDKDIDFSDIPEADEEWFKNAQVVYPEPKKPVSLRIDSDVLTWFKTEGNGYQTRMNAVLRSYVKAQKEKTK